LRHIEAFVELLQKNAGTVLEKQSRHYIHTITDGTQKMGPLIDDLLSFSRMLRKATTFQPLELAHLACDVIQELEPDAAGRTIDWRIGNLPAVEGDAAMPRIVLANLLSNALKFTRCRKGAQTEGATQDGFIGSYPPPGRRPRGRGTGSSYD
jgi:light-regulated signal transduction histidine kinase (bacteriophytochrome)